MSIFMQRFKTIISLNILLMPIWFLALFTTAKSFRDNPIIGSPWLNRLGLHSLRQIIAALIMRWRMCLLGFAIPAVDRKQYAEQGFLVKEDFLPDDLFQQVEQEVRGFKGEVRECVQGDTQNHRILLDPHTLKQLPATRTLLERQDLQRLLRYTAGHARLPFFHIEQVRNGFAPHGDDPQKKLHSDTFHPNMKFWLFLDDVDAHNGPFSYVPYSNRLDRKRLAFEYRLSQHARHHPDSYTARGSLRFNSENLSALGLPDAKPLMVKKNTLVIANTFGIHGRGSAVAGSTRLAIWGMSRTNPFIPLPGLGFKFVNTWQYTVFNKFRAYEDARAAKRGTKAPWHRIN